MEKKKKERVLIELSERLFGEEARKIVEYLLKNESEITDEQISQKLDIKINNVRKLLYLLSEHKILYYKRSRDKETGYYVYYWRPNLENLDEILVHRKMLVLSKLEARLEYEKNAPSYACTQDYSRYSLEEAMKYDFKCPRCGGGIDYYDSSNFIRKLEERINKLREEIGNEIKRRSS